MPDVPIAPGDAWHVALFPRVQDFISGSEGRRVRYVGEPIWATRSDGELREATRHEALINLAFGRSGDDGTAIRLHMGLPAWRAP